MLNTAEAARLLRVSQASIRRWADSGRLPSGRVGGRRERRFRESDLIAFMERTPAAGGGEAITVGGAVVRPPVHLATFFSSDEGGLRLSVPFLADGLRILGQAGILVAGEPLVSRYIAALGDQTGVNLDAATSAGLFATVMLVGANAQDAIAQWERRFAELVARGVSVIRIVGEMTSERKMFASEDEMLRYEEAFQLMCKRYPVAVICQYDAREFSGAAVLRAMKAHPDMFEFRIGAFLN